MEFLVLLLAVVATADAVGLGAQYILSPSSRTVYPTAIYRSTGNVTDISTSQAANAASSVKSTFRLAGPNATITYDFGRMVAGIPSVNFGETSCTFCNTLFLPGFSCGALCNGVGVAYTEAVDFVGVASDNTTLYTHPDGTLYVPVAANTSYTLPAAWGRGSFRYLTLSLPALASDSQSVELQLDHLTFNPQPSRRVPSDYGGSYFESSDDLLNRIWYAGAYTVQLCTIPANSSVQHTRLLDAVGWSEDATAVGLTGSDEYLADGAKRDRNPWAGDMAVALRSALVLQSNITSVRNSIREMLILQDGISGYFPYAGSPLGNLFQLVGSAYDSDTYHLWTIASFAEYVLASGDTTFGGAYWSAIVEGIAGTYTYIDPTTGLFNGTRTDDWGRIGQGGQNAALNALYSYTLSITARAGTYLNQSQAELAEYATRAAAVKAAVNAHLYDATAGLYWDNTTAAGHSIHPQDGNVLAIHFNITSSTSQALTIAQSLAARHGQFGAVPPEAPGAISPFISGLELFAQIAASPADASRALSLLRTQWGYMLDAFSNSTFIEGYSTDGTLEYPFYPGGSSFISHAHGWSTGPTYTLTCLVGGLRASVFDVPSADGDWVFRPSARGSGLDSLHAGFDRPEGAYTVSWTLDGDSFHATFAVPTGTTGTVYIPAPGDEGAHATLDGEEITATNNNTADGFIRVPVVTGGEHHVVVSS